MKTDPNIPTADEATAAAVQRAAYFTAALALGWPKGTIVHELKTLALARQAALLMPKVYGPTHRRAIVYAITPEGHSFMVPDNMQISQ